MCVVRHQGRGRHQLGRGQQGQQGVLRVLLLRCLPERRLWQQRVLLRVLLLLLLQVQPGWCSQGGSTQPTAAGASRR